MKNNVFFGIAFRIIALFAIAMIGSYAPEQLRSFFGDNLHEHIKGCAKHYTGCVNTKNMMDNEWDWGVRHYWYFHMILILFLLSCVNVIMGSINLIKGNYDIK